MPYTVEADRFRFTKPGDPICAQQYIEFLPVNAIHIGPGEPPFTDCIHTGAVAAFPVIDKGLPVHGNPFLPSKGLELFDDAAAPVNDRVVF
jgi:hypothetical protein